MRCDEVQSLLDEYANGTLTQDETAAVASHVERCDNCRAALGSMTRLQHEVQSLPNEISPGRDLWLPIAERIGVPHPAVVRHDFGKGMVARNRAGRGWTISLATAAVFVIAVGSFWLSTRPGRAGWNVEKLEGTPVVDNERIANGGRLHIGDWLETDASSKARLLVGSIGEVEIEPNTRLKLVQSSTTDHRVALEQGTIHATIWAPPRLFFVETPSAVAVDLGCAYTLTVDESGASFLHVTAGYVALEFDGHESFIPEGAMCGTRPGRGPGTPFLENASELMRTALTHYDFENGGAVALNNVLTQSRATDALTLWHLLKNASSSERELVFDKLASIAPPPEDVTKDGVLHGDRSMVDRWGQDLGIPGM